MLHVHHFLYLRYCRAVDILPNFCRPIAIQAAIHLCFRFRFRFRAVCPKVKLLKNHVRTAHGFDFQPLVTFWTSGQKCVGRLCGIFL